MSLSLSHTHTYTHTHIHTHTDTHTHTVSIREGALPSTMLGPCVNGRIRRNESLVTEVASAVDDTFEVFAAVLVYIRVTWQVRGDKLAHSWALLLPPLHLVVTELGLVRSAAISSREVVRGNLCKHLLEVIHRRLAQITH